MLPSVAQLVAVLPAAKPASQSLWSCQNLFVSSKTTLSRGCEGREPKAQAVSKTAGLAKPASALSAVFQNVFSVNHQTRREENIHHL